VITDVSNDPIPGQTAPTRVVYHITAADAGGRAGRYPADPGGTALGCER
jgi:hypothetical protein